MLEREAELTGRGRRGRWRCTWAEAVLGAQAGDAFLRGGRWTQRRGE